MSLISFPHLFKFLHLFAPFQHSETYVVPGCKLRGLSLKVCFQQLFDLAIMTSVATIGKQKCDCGVFMHWRLHFNITFKSWIHNFTLCFKWLKNLHCNYIQVPKHFFISAQHKFNCDSCCCVEWTSLVFFDAACYPDVAFHTSTEGRDGSSSCYVTALSVTTCDLQYDVNFIASA